MAAEHQALAPSGLLGLLGPQGSQAPPPRVAEASGCKAKAAKAATWSGICGMVLGASENSDLTTTASCSQMVLALTRATASHLPNSALPLKA